MNDPTVNNKVKCPLLYCVFLQAVFHQDIFLLINKKSLHI